MFHIVTLRALASVAVLALVPLSAQGAAKPVVTVFAAASLREAFEDAAPAFTKQTGYPVQFSFAGSDALAAQLLQGAPADVFASANEAQMKRVASLVDAPRTLAHNHLVVIAPRNDDAVGSIADLGKKGVRLILAAASVPAGIYSREALANLGKDRAFG